MDKDPLDFTRRESVINSNNPKPQKSSPLTMKQQHRPANISMPPDNSDEMIIISDEDDEDEYEEDFKKNPMSQMDFIDELETVY